MSTTPTNQPVPSEKPQDLKFNAGKIDEFVTLMAKQYIDRFGQAHYTIEGLRWVAQQAIAAFGYITLDSFEDGNTLTLPNQVLRLKASGEYYRWDGAFPKDVPAGSTPESSGGLGVGAWVGVGDASLRGDLASHASGKGAELVALKQQVANAKERTVHDWIADIITAKDGVNIIADGINNDAVGINAFLPVLAATQRELILVPGVYLINDDITIDIPITFQPGAILTPRNGAQLTFNSEIRAGCYKIFDTEDDFYAEPEAKTSIKITGVNVRPEWFGATTISDVDAILNITDSSSAFRKAFRATTGDFKPINSTSFRSEFICKKIELSNGHYRMDKPTTHGFYNNGMFYKVDGGGYIGKGMGNSILVYTDLQYEGNSFLTFHMVHGKCMN